MLRIAIITTDNREDRRDFTNPLPWFGTAPQALLDGFACLPEDIEVHVLSCARRRLPSPLKLAANITFHSLYVPPWAWLKSGYIGNILAVKRCLKQIQPDLVHGQGTERDCAIAAVFSGYPNLITLHGNMRRLAALARVKPWSFAGLTSFLESIAIRLSGGVICLSKHAAALVESQATATWIVPNAVDPTYIHNHQSKTEALPIVLLVGDLLPNKNQLAFLEAILPIQAELGLQARLCGKYDPLNPYAQRVLDFAGQHDWVKICGFLDRDSLKREMEKANLLALPSLEENLPMVILEAMATGLPVAASSVGGIPGVIEHRKTGMLFDPEDAESIRASIRDLVQDDQNLCFVVTENANCQIEKEHIPVTIAQKHIEIYKRIIST